MIVVSEAITPPEGTPGLEEELENSIKCNCLTRCNDKSYEIQPSSTKILNNQKTFDRFL